MKKRTYQFVLVYDVKDNISKRCLMLVLYISNVRERYLIYCVNRREKHVLEMHLARSIIWRIRKSLLNV